MDDKLILLRKNKSVSVCDVKDGVDETRKNSDVEYIMIDVGMYSHEYLIIPRYKFLRKFKIMEISFEYHVEAYTDGLTSYSEAKPGRIVCKNVVEFYRAVHSIQKLFGAIHIMSDDFYAINYEGKLTHVNIFIEIGKRTQSICIETSTESSSKYDVNYVLETINYMVYGNPSIPVIPDRDEIPKDFKLDIEELKWRDNSQRSSMVPEFQGVFKCWSFIPYNDWQIIFAMQSANISEITYVPIRQRPLPYGVTIDASNLYELSGEYIEIVTERDLKLWRPDTSSITEFILNAKYIFMSSFVNKQAEYGFMDEDMIIILSYTFRREDGPKYNYVPFFEFGINRDMIESDCNIYEKFMKSLSKNYKKFIEGGCIEDEY